MICTHPLCRISGPKVQFYSAVVIHTPSLISNLIPPPLHASTYSLSQSPSLPLTHSHVPPYTHPHTLCLNHLHSLSHTLTSPLTRIHILSVPITFTPSHKLVKIIDSGFRIQDSVPRTVHVKIQYELIWNPY